MNLAGRRDIAAQHVFEMDSRTGLVTQDMQGHSQNPFPDESIGRLHRYVGKRGQSHSDLQRSPVVAVEVSPDPETPQAPEPIFAVVQFLRQIGDARPGAIYLRSLAG